MTAAETIVKSLLETEAADFVKSMPPSTWASFHIIRNGEHNVYTDDSWSRGRGNLHIVYKNEDDGTRDFIGLIDEIPGRRRVWYPVAVAKEYPGKPTRKVGIDDDYGRYPTKNDAAKALYDIYVQENHRK